MPYGNMFPQRAMGDLACRMRRGNLLTQSECKVERDNASPGNRSLSHCRLLEHFLNFDIFENISMDVAKNTNYNIH